MHSEYWQVKENPVRDKSFAFALRVIKLNQFLLEQKKEFVMSKQLLRAGTAIGALIREAEYAESRADFKHKMMIALKEANETAYWLELLHQSEHIDDDGYHSIYPQAVELLKLLISITKSTEK